MDHPAAAFLFESFDRHALAPDGPSDVAGLQAIADSGRGLGSLQLAFRNVLRAGRQSRHVDQRARCGAASDGHGREKK